MNDTEINRLVAEAMSCSVEGCDKKPVGRGWCPKHWTRWKKWGSVEDRPRPTPKICRIEGCDVPSRARDLCKRHYGRWLRQGNPEISLMGKADHRPDDVRFWEKVAITVDDQQCWEWQGCRNCKGYGRFGANGKIYETHVYSYFLAHNEWPCQHVLHSCDNAPCVNPKHLRQGSHQDNMADRKARNRTAKGSRVPQSVLNEETVRRIKQMIANGARNVDIAQTFGIDPSAVSKIRGGKLWKHV